MQLKSALEAFGFKQSKLDACLFESDKVICLCYVDDCLFFAKQEADIDSVIQSLNDKKCKDHLICNVEDDVAGFLGIAMEKKKDGTIELKQTGLIKRILEAMNMEDCTMKDTPADPTALPKDTDGPACQETWSYALIVGMMMYLASNSRPDIAFAVHQCAHFTHAPREKHEKALKRIAHYLQATKDRGMCIRPNSKLKLDCFADADFAGLWNSEDSLDPTCVKSRTGFIITLGGSPVLWQSKLQTKIALSTTEAEFCALSTAMRDLIPMRRLVESLCTSLGITRNAGSIISTVWEDNNGALVMATNNIAKMTPRSKHIAVEMHWFKEHIEPGQIEVRRIDTKVHQADIFTKGLVSAEFGPKCKLLMGWDPRDIIKSYIKKEDAPTLERECQDTQASVPEGH